MAFPTDFNERVEPFRKRLQRKHGKESEEGRAIDELREIRVQASPDWAADRVSLFFWFIREEGGAVSNWAKLVEGWVALVKPDGRFHEILGQATLLQDMTALEYVDSVRLELDHLSAPEDPETTAGHPAEARAPNGPERR